MEKKTYRVKKSELDRMIAEEVKDVQEMARLRQELKKINEDIETLSNKRIDETEEVSEVSVGGRKSGEEYYEKDTPVAKFEKIGTHLKEDEFEAEEEMGEFEAKLAELGRALDARMDEKEGDDFEDDMEAEDELEDELEDEIGVEDADVEDIEGVEECGMEEEVVSEEVVEISEEEVNEEEVNEDVVEEQDGESVASAADADTVNDNMDKVDNKNPMADKMYEDEDILGKNSNPLLKEELKRMRQLLGRSIQQ